MRMGRSCEQMESQEESQRYLGWGHVWGPSSEMVSLACTIACTGTAEGKGKGIMGSGCRGPGLLGNSVFFLTKDSGGGGWFKARRLAVRME